MTNNREVILLEDSKRVAEATIASIITVYILKAFSLSNTGIMYFPIGYIIYSIVIFAKDFICQK